MTTEGTLVGVSILVSTAHRAVSLVADYWLMGDGTGWLTQKKKRKKSEYIDFSFSKNEQWGFKFTLNMH